MRSITLRLLPPLALALGLLLALIIGLRPVIADEPAPGPERADPRGWSKGVPAAGVQQALAAHAVVPVDLPAALARDITQRTALFYFSPTCPHCTAAMPEINALAKRDTGLKWIGVASGASTEEQLLEFEATYQPAFELVIDTDRSFAAALGARSTPSLYIARPLRPEEDTSGLPPAQGFGRVGIDEAYAPFGRGAGGVLLLRSDPANPFKHFTGDYQGETTCGVCHSEERLSMAITHHQAALWTLYRRERHTEEPCVKCHVTGMGAPGGFVMGDLGHPMAGVQCEACHGPGGPHDGQRQDAKTSCVGCHDKEHSVAFSVEKGLPHIDHFKANHMSEAELHAALAAIEEGSAAKPLLAFPEGPTVGAASCKSCHKKQHKWGQRDPHRGAMARLSEGEDAQRVECVRCHATPKAVGIGAPRASAADFRVDEGVGCESCHGPGGAHAAAPSKDNIVGLGDSCPECVIEAICTSCHDQTWDPKWELKARMAAIPH